MWCSESVSRMIVSGYCFYPHVYGFDARFLAVILILYFMQAIRWSSHDDSEILYEWEWQDWIRHYLPRKKEMLNPSHKNAWYFSDGLTLLILLLYLSCARRFVWYRVNTTFIWYRYKLVNITDNGVKPLQIVLWRMEDGIIGVAMCVANLQLSSDWALSKSYGSVDRELYIKFIYNRWCIWSSTWYLQESR